jgi:hypothetical protein
MKELDESFELLHRDARRAPASLTDARAKLMAALDTEDASPQRAPRRQRRLMIPVAATAAAAVIAVGFLVVPSLAPEPPALGTSTPDVTLLSASEVLIKAADLTVGAVDQPIGPGQYRYISNHAWNTRTARIKDGSTGYTYLWELQTDRWIPADPRGVWQENRRVLDTSKFLGGSPENVAQAKAAAPQISATDQGRWVAPCGNFFPRAKPVKICGDPDDWDSAEFYAKLPRDPGRLYEFLAGITKNRGSTPQGMFHYGIQILATGLMPADLRAEWYRAMAKIPGIEVVSTQANLDGRTGIALGLSDEHEQRQLIIDPATGAFIGERTVAGAKPDEPWIKPGTETGASAIRTEVVDRMGQTK